MKHSQISFIKKKNSSQLTSEYYLTDVSVESEYVYCYGQIKKGSYLCTCPIKGVAMVAGGKDVAFAVAVEDKSEPYIAPIKIKMLEEGEPCEDADRHSLY